MLFELIIMAFIIFWSVVGCVLLLRYYYHKPVAILPQNPLAQMRLAIWKSEPDKNGNFRLEVKMTSDGKEITVGHVFTVAAYLTSLYARESGNGFEHSCEQIMEEAMKFS